MDQSVPPATPAPTAEASPASSSAASRQGATTCTTAEQVHFNIGGGGEAEAVAEAEDGKPSPAAVVDHAVKGDATNVDNVDNDPSEMEAGMEMEKGGGGDMTDGDADTVAARSQGQGQGQGHEQKKRPPRVGSVRQGRKEKRKAEWKAKKARMKETKLLERQQREEKARKEGREVKSAGVNYRDLPREQWSVSQKINHAKRLEFEEKSAQGGYRVCIDMAFDHLMLEKAQASVGQQVMYAYSANRKAVQPCRITLSGLGEVMRAQISKLTGFETWLGVTTDSRCYTEIFDKEELVYLTADSLDTITQLEKGKVYILGGLVDRNAHKGLCFKKAMDQGLATAKLPLKRGDLNGAHTEVLATNHVFDILVQAMGAGGNLEKIQEKTLPPRKRAGWTGGDDRGPSSKSAAKQSGVDTDQQYGEVGLNSTSSSAENSDEQGAPMEGRGGASATNLSGEDHSPTSNVAPSNPEKAGKQNNTDGSDDRDPHTERGSADDIEIEGGGKGKDKHESKVNGEERPAQADEGVAVSTGELVVVKRAVDEGQKVGSSAGVGGSGTCKRGRTEADCAGIA